MKICKDGAVLVIAYAISLYPSIPDEAGLKILRKDLMNLQRQRYLLRTYYRCRSMFLKFFFFFVNLMERLNNKNQEQQI